MCIHISNDARNYKISQERAFTTTTAFHIGYRLKIITEVNKFIKSTVIVSLS